MRVPSGAVNYLMADHLGGTTGLLSSTGDLVFGSATKYWPYGNTRSTTEVSETDMRFTGQREEPGDAALGLYNYKARFYSTVMGRFVSADPLTSDGLNRYAYVRGNPLRYTDPTGLCHGGGPDCPPPAPTPSPTATPTPGGYELDVCAMHLAGCLLLGAVSQFGSSDLGMAIVMGMHQTASGSIELFSNYVQEFLSRTSNCSGKVAACYASFTEILKYAGADAAYGIFGVKVITTDAGGNYIGGIAGHIGGRVPGGDVLADFMRAPGKDLIGVIGYSLGANTVAEYFAHHRNRLVPFVLIAPETFGLLPTHVYPGRVQNLPQHVQTSGFLPHTTNNTPENGKWVVDQLVDRARVLASYPQ